MNIRAQLALLTIAASVALPTVAWAGCLTSLTSTASVTSKVRGLYVNQSGAGSMHFVILDKASCQATQGEGATLGSQTRDVHYLRIRDEDKALLSVLLAAQADNTAVGFRLLAPIDNVNVIGYVISPAGADVQ